MKKLYADILMTGLLCSAALTANAFEYVSSEAGFSVNIPDQNIMLIGENMFAAENRVFDLDKKLVKTNGMHFVTGLNQEQLKQNFNTVFTTEKFTADLNNIKKALKNGTAADVLQSSSYKYLTEAAAGAYVNYSGESEDLAGLLELNKQFAGMANIKKASVENIKGKGALMIESDIKNITFELKLPLKKSELLPQKSVDEENLKDQGFKFEFADDGYLVTKIANLYNITEKTYLLSANDNLYTVTSLFASTNDLPDNVDSLYKLDNKGFNKLSKQLVNSLKFTEPQKNGNKPLTINDNISGRKLQLPKKWLYTRTDFSSIYGINKGGFGLTAYSALPETSLDAANNAIKTFGISFDNSTNTLKMDLSQFTMPDLLNLFDEGIVMASGNFNVEQAVSFGMINKNGAENFYAEWKTLFDNPELTKFIFHNSMNQLFNSLRPEDIAAIEKYLKAENFNYTFDINNYNARFNCNADLKAHIPDIFKVLQEANVIAGNAADADEMRSSLSKDKVFAMLDTNLVPFNCYFKNQLYFDRSQRFNNLLYFTKGDKATANQQIMKQFNTTDLYLY